MTDTTTSATRAAASLERDREAVRSLAGVYDVGYTAVVSSLGTAEAASAMTREARAREAVLLAEDTPASITLVHLLLVGDPPAVAKHWTQAWTPNPETALVFEPDGRWGTTSVSRGEGPTAVWRVRVAEADERPAFDLLGSWAHGGAQNAEGEEARSRWASAAWTPRPADTRGGLGVGADAGWSAATMLRVGPEGWAVTADGQDAGGAAVVRTAVFRRLEGAEADALRDAATRWWQRRDVFWSRVRRWWTGAASEGFAVRVPADGEPMWQAVFRLEEQARGGELEGEAIDEAIERVMREYGAVSP